jgi:hypothetical protein
MNHVRCEFMCKFQNGSADLSYVILLIISAKVYDFLLEMNYEV